MSILEKVTAVYELVESSYGGGNPETRERSVLETVTREQVKTAGEETLCSLY
jgi:hypothetical protein